MTQGPLARLAVVIPAWNEADRIADTVAAAITLPGADLVAVVDDGSRDGTADIARQAGAVVLGHARNRGKAAAMETGAEAVRLADQRDGVSRALLFLDADLGATAAQAGPLADPVLAGTADMTIAAFTTRVKLGGHGLVVRLSARGTRRAIGWAPAQPLNGQRCLTRAAFDAARPLARGFGVETALTIDLVRKGLRVLEVEVGLEHRATGTDLRSQLHRARQFADVGLALVPRLLLAPPTLLPSPSLGPVSPGSHHPRSRLPAAPLPPPRRLPEMVAERNRYTALCDISGAVGDSSSGRGSGIVGRDGSPGTFGQAEVTRGDPARPG